MTEKKTPARRAPRKTTTRASSTTTRASAKPPAASKPASPVTIDQATPSAAAPEEDLQRAVAATLDPRVLPASQQPDLKKRELVDKIVKRTGIKKKDVKPVIEEALQILGDALSDGRELNLKPFGKMKVQRVKDVQNGQVLVTKVRQPDETPKAAADPLAEPAE